MNNAGQKIVVSGIYHPDGAWPLAGAQATNAAPDGAWRRHQRRLPVPRKRRAVLETVLGFRIAIDRIPNKCILEA